MPNGSSKETSVSRDVGAYILKIQGRRSRIEQCRVSVVSKGTAFTFDPTGLEPIIPEVSSARCQPDRPLGLISAPTGSTIVHKLHTRSQNDNIPMVSPISSDRVQTVSDDFKPTSTHFFQLSTKSSLGKTQKIPTYAEPKMPATSDSFTMLRKVELEMANCSLRRSYLRGQSTYGEMM